VALRIHGREFAPAQENHLFLQAALAIDPFADMEGVNLPKGLRADRAMNRTSLRSRHPGGMETEQRAFRDTNTVARDETENHRAGREAWAVDHDPVAGVAERGEILDILTDASAHIVLNSYQGRSTAPRERRYDGSEHCHTTQHVIEPPPYDSSSLNLVTAVSSRSNKSKAARRISPLENVEKWVLRDYSVTL